MSEDRDSERSLDQSAVDRFIISRIDSVPHLEALLLLWRSRPVPRAASAASASQAHPAAFSSAPESGLWSIEQIAHRLWVAPESARTVLLDLKNSQLIAEAKPETRYYYKSDPELDPLLQAVDATYAREMIRISNMIHSKGSAAVRDFARAFRFKKDQE